MTDLLPFRNTPSVACPKCGEPLVDALMRSPAWLRIADTKPGDKRECLQFSCYCGFSWLTETADAS